MLTYGELIELRDKLTNGEIEIDFAQVQYWKDFKEGQRSWETKDWKERRSGFLKDKCEICSSADTLTIQHHSHPRKYSEYLRDITSEYTKEYINTKPEVDKGDLQRYIIQNYDYVPVPLCPNCKRSSLRERKKILPKYRCPVCHEEFDDTVIRSVDELISKFLENEDDVEARDKCFVSKDQWRNKHNLSNIRYWLQRGRAKTKDSKTIEREAFLLYLNDCIKYLSFEDTITACKKCAFNFDIKRMELCPNCKRFYKGLEYPTCIQCLPEEKREAALKIIEFGNDWRKMHEDLGID
ncbi:hypothetical protein [Paraflavitalea sp. CAU 1676]|uniref:hypothetical protein n=1 Tax=Paraflavitalea sp. CAU 1676 TaxID=3032598 RepID=UPI0023DC3206|nr:hypothetical protein [Paraflavitalea sp. CAU 1676]MDF2190544.1 hypothetical protein [Paraflavitalea sp. CAU 1676]